MSKHWLIEIFIFAEGWRRHTFCGRRMTCDNGKTWVVSGTVTFGRGDSFESRSRMLGAHEVAATCERYRNRNITVQAREDCVLHSARAGA